MLRKMPRNRSEKGFTLVELMITVLLIGILAAIAIPVFANAQKEGYRAQVQSDLRNSASPVSQKLYKDGEITQLPNDVVITTGTEMKLEGIGTGALYTNPELSTPLKRYETDNVTAWAETEKMLKVNTGEPGLTFATYIGGAFYLGEGTSARGWNYYVYPSTGGTWKMVEEILADICTVNPANQFPASSPAGLACNDGDYSYFRTRWDHTIAQNGIYEIRHIDRDSNNTSDIQASMPGYSRSEGSYCATTMKPFAPSTGFFEGIWPMENRNPSTYQFTDTNYTMTADGPRVAYLPCPYSTRTDLWGEPSAGKTITRDAGFCLEAIHENYDDLIYHYKSNVGKVTAGACNSTPAN